MFNQEIIVLLLRDKKNIFILLNSYTDLSNIYTRKLLENMKTKMAD